MAANDDVLFIPFSGWDEAERPTISYVAPGDYKVRIKSATKVKVKNGANAGVPGVQVFFEIIEGDFTGSFLTDRFYAMDSTFWRIAWFLRTVGIKVSKKDMSLPIKQLVGRTLIVTVKDGEEYNGNPRNEISAFNPAAKTASVETETFSADELPDPWEGTGAESNVSPDKADKILGDAVRNEYSASDDPWALDTNVSL